MYGASVIRVPLKKLAFIRGALNSENTLYLGLGSFRHRQIDERAFERDDERLGGQQPQAHPETLTGGQSSIGNENGAQF